MTFWEFADHHPVVTLFGLIFAALLFLALLIVIGGELRIERRFK